MKTTTVSDAQTRAVARRLASLLRPNDVLLLCGPLGSGKTAFVAGLAEGLGIDDPVTSPSFVIAHRYDGGFIPLVHADVYRLGSLNEVLDLDLFDEARDAVLAIEWGDAVVAAVPGEYLRIVLEVTGDNERRITFEPHGTSWAQRPFQDVLS